MTLPQTGTQRGSVTVFVVVLTVALGALAGLVVDGGAILAAHRRAFDQAEAAARAGSQAVDTSVLRATGTVTLDPGEARRRADEYLVRIGREGTTRVSGDTVEVRLSFRQPLSVLAAFGLGPVTVDGEGQATAVPGVVAGAVP